jgi:hypothetical protein
MSSKAVIVNNVARLKNSVLLKINLRLAKQSQFFAADLFQVVSDVIYIKLYDSYLLSSINVIAHV